MGAWLSSIPFPAVGHFQALGYCESLLSPFSTLVAFGEMRAAKAAGEVWRRPLVCERVGAGFPTLLGFPHLGLLHRQLYGKLPFFLFCSTRVY